MTNHYFQQRGNDVTILGAPYSQPTSQLVPLPAPATPSVQVHPPVATENGGAEVSLNHSPPQPPQTPKLLPRSTTASTDNHMAPNGSSPPPMPFPSSYPQPAAFPQSPAGPSSHRSVPPPKLLSTHLIAHPNDTAGRAMKKVFPSPNPIKRLIRRFKVKHSVIDGLTPSQEEHWNAKGSALRRRAGWRLKDEEGDGVPVSELFWKVSSVA